MSPHVQHLIHSELGQGVDAETPHLTLGAIWQEVAVFSCHVSTSDWPKAKILALETKRPKGMWPKPAHWVSYKYLAFFQALFICIFDSILRVLERDNAC